jgi:MFS transporter, ACS family, tartrate transporter
MAEERRRGERTGQVLNRFLPVLTDLRVWLITLTYLCFLMGAYGIQVWLPLILKQGNMSNLAVSFLSAVPYLFASIGMISWAWFADRYGRRTLNLAVSCLLAAAGFGLALVTHDFTLSLIGLTIALVGANAARAILWAIPALYLTGVAAAGGLAFINSLGTLGGFFGPWLIGWLKDTTGSFTAGLTAMMAFLLLGAVFAFLLRWVTRNEVSD